MKLAFLLMALALVVCGCNSERARTEKLLGVKVNNLPTSQGIDDFDEVDFDPTASKDAAYLEGSIEADIPQSVERRSSVYATAPDGTVWEAYCGKAGDAPVVPDEVDYRPGRLTRQTSVVYNGPDSTPANTRQHYDTHHGYSYHPPDVFIGKRTDGQLSTSLFFRDVGSHLTAPHHLAIDGSGDAHLVVADVNTSENNDLDLYWVIGSPATGKWNAAWIIEHPGFTSVVKVWNGASGKKVHLLWSWDTGQNQVPQMGLYYLEKDDARFSRKVRLVAGSVYRWSAAINPVTGRILVTYSYDQDTYTMSKPVGGKWSRPVSISDVPSRNLDVQTVPTNYYIGRITPEK